MDGQYGNAHLTAGYCGTRLRCHDAWHSRDDRNASVRHRLCDDLGWNRDLLRTTIMEHRLDLGRVDKLPNSSGSCVDCIRQRSKYVFNVINCDGDADIWRSLRAVAQKQTIGDRPRFS
jgi:hypothetical protein